MARSKNQKKEDALYRIPLNGIIRATKEAAYKDILKSDDIQLYLKNMGGSFNFCSSKGCIQHLFETRYNQNTKTIKWTLKSKVKNAFFGIEVFSERLKQESFMVIDTAVPREIFLYYLKERLNQMNKNINQMNKFINSEVIFNSKLPSGIYNKIIKVAKKFGVTEISVPAAMADIRYYSLDDNHKLEFDIFCEPQLGLIHSKVKLRIKGLRSSIILLEKEISAYDKTTQSKILNDLKKDFGSMERALRGWNRNFR